MPPEQIQGAGTIDGRADVYALGGMTHQMLVGKAPFGQGNPGALLMAHLTHPPPDPSSVVPRLPSQAVKAIRKAIAKDPSDRFASAGIFASAL
jgi:serine/threonine protein kinase